MCCIQLGLVIFYKPSESISHPTPAHCVREHALYYSMYTTTDLDHLLSQYTEHARYDRPPSVPS
jgi:hypothetical protein